MRFYNIDVKGKFWVQRGNSLPVGTGPADEGRLYYQESDESLYLHKSSSWGSLGGYSDVPLGTIILMERDTAQTGYSLKVDDDDGVIYFTKGSVAGGETGGTAKSGGSWTHASHDHTTTGHALSIAEMPQHRHTYVKPTTYGFPWSVDDTPGWYGSTTGYTNYQGSSAAHSHGNTGTSAEPNTWRPKGINYTRQERI